MPERGATAEVAGDAPRTAALDVLAAQVDALAAQALAGRKVGEPVHVSVQHVCDQHLAAGVSEAVMAILVAVARGAIREVGGAPPECGLSAAVEAAIVADEASPPAGMTKADREALAFVGCVVVTNDRVVAAERRG